MFINEIECMHIPKDSGTGYISDVESRTHIKKRGETEKPYE
jgi:hypothetical protein